VKNFSLVIRVALLGIIGVGGTTLAGPASAQPEPTAQCSDWSDMIGTYHRFGAGGGCYQGAPNSIHIDSRVGYCQSYHYACEL
jgi:hypothetical protein